MRHRDQKLRGESWSTVSWIKQRWRTVRMTSQDGIMRELDASPRMLLRVCHKPGHGVCVSQISGVFAYNLHFKWTTEGQGRFRSSSPASPSPLHNGVS